jgi:glycosyltransferase involved in cell wall biosynthesis
VVASDFPLYRSLLQDANCGVFVDPKNEYEIAQALQKLSANKEHTLSMGQSARASFEALYNWEKETQTLSAFYLSI